MQPRVDSFGGSKTGEKLKRAVRGIAEGHGTMPRVNKQGKEGYSAAVIYSQRRNAISEKTAVVQSVLFTSLIPWAGRSSTLQLVIFSKILSVFINVAFSGKGDKFYLLMLCWCFWVLLLNCDISHFSLPFKTV